MSTTSTPPDDSSGNERPLVEIPGNVPPEAVTSDKNEVESPLLRSDSALSVMHRRGLEYAKKIDYEKSASLPLEESIRIANKHTRRRRQAGL